MSTKCLAADDCAKARRSSPCPDRFGRQRRCRTPVGRLGGLAECSSRCGDPVPAGRIFRVPAAADRSPRSGTGSAVHPTTKRASVEGPFPLEGPLAKTQRPVLPKPPLARSLAAKSFDDASKCGAARHGNDDRAAPRRSSGCSVYAYRRHGSSSSPSAVPGSPSRSARRGCRARSRACARGPERGRITAASPGSATWIATPVGTSSTCPGASEQRRVDARAQIHSGGARAVAYAGKMRRECARRGPSARSAPLRVVSGVQRRGQPLARSR